MIRFAENLNKMIAAGLGGALEAPRTEVAVGHRVRYLESSGAVASFETNIVAPIRSLRVDMQPIQAGSGDPSPDNIRPISGRQSVTVTRMGKNIADDGHSVTIQLGQTVYGGTVDVITGKATIAWKKYTGSAFANSSARTGGFYSRMLLGGETYAGGQLTPARYACNAAVKSQNQYDKWYYNAAGTVGSTVNYVHMYIPESAIDYHEGDNITALLNAAYNASDFEFILPIPEPFDIDLTPASLSTLKGTNNVWSDAGDVTLEYPYYEETEGY